MEPNENPYRSPLNESRPTANANVRRLTWWHYAIVHFAVVAMGTAASVLLMIGSRETIQAMEPPPWVGIPLGAAFLTFFFAGPLVDLYLIALAIRRPSAYRNLAVLDSVLTVIHWYMTLLPAVSP